MNVQKNDNLILMRNKLIELLDEAIYEQGYCTSDGVPVTTVLKRIVAKDECFILAEYLLKNGVIVPPCKYDEITFHDAISVIRGLGQEWEAIKMLTDLVRSDKETADKQNSEMSNCLRAIKKINNGKNEAIDALCEH